MTNILKIHIHQNSFFTHHHFHHFFVKKNDKIIFSVVNDDPAKFPN